MSAAFADALAALRGEESTLVDRLDKVRSVIGSLEQLVGTTVVPPARPPAPQPRQIGRRTAATATPNPALSTAPATGALDAKLLEAISELGPTSGAALAKRVKQSVFTVRARLEGMASTRLVHAEGSGKGKKWHLGAKGSSRGPKEAPQRR